MFNLPKKTIPFLVLTVLSALLFVPGGCKGKGGKENKPLARVGSKYLYASQLPAIYGPGISADDSAMIRKTFIDKWVRRQLMLDKAEHNLTDEQKDVNEQLDEYRASLLIYKYQQMLLKQQLDTFVTDETLEQYYNEHNSSFSLNQCAFKGVFIRLPKDAPNLDKVRSWIHSESDNDVKSLESYCYQYAKKYDYFNDQWTYFQNIQYLMPFLKTNPEQFLRANKYFETSDSLNLYMVYVKDYKLPGTLAPLELVQNDIRSIILNKRKIDFIKAMENNIYDKALDHDKVEIFDK